ncbi:MAG: ABC transporter ATP-binding protein [Actinomycetota bacterium]|nr:ABC transporter ATP-binding protein [Actinomycetota bacterium]
MTTTEPRTAERRTGDPVLAVDGLEIDFATEHGWVRVVDGVSFSVGRGETLAIVGESGSGKSVTSLACMGLLPPAGRVAGGSVVLDGTDVLSLPARAVEDLRGDRIAMVFQEPMSSLNPAYRVGEQIAEVVRRHRGASRKTAAARAVEVLDLVGIPRAADRARAYPHEFSGGMRQRVMIAMALACEPDALIADEPTTALDVTIQAQVLDLLREMRDELGMALLFITHDLAVVADIADRVMVMYSGQAVEAASVGGLFYGPRHPYSEGLMRSMPQVGTRRARLDSIPGQPPPPWRLPPGCRFAPRCPYATDRCRQAPPELAATGSDHLTRCIRSDEITLRGAR